MRNMILHSIVPIFLFVFPILTESADLDDANIFTIPEILRDNVDFWKKIYTDVSLKEGLLHDRDYPLVIYDKIFIGDKTGRARSSTIQNVRDRVQVSLQRINSEPDSAWSPAEKRIKAMFKGYAPPDALIDADSRIRFQQGQKERFLEGLIRSGMYIDTIRTILTAHGVPLRLAFLPHVESSFRSDAYSKAGAAGLWQFMRGTGKSYLTINYLVDERLDPILSAVAAAKLLAHNYSVLKAWPLAITAYNHGLNGMRRAVENTGSRDIAVIIQKHQSRSFKFASKNFYGCFLAASEIAGDPAPWFGHVSYMPKVTRRDLVLTHNIRTDAISRYLDIPENTLARMNPALRPVVFSQKKPIPAGYTLHLPPDYPDIDLERALARIPDTLKSSGSEQPDYYHVRKGDNLYSIAYRLGVSAAALAEENDITRINKIYAGQILRMPQKRGVPAAGPAVAVIAETPVLASAEEEQPVVEESIVSAVGPVTDTLVEIATATADTIPDVFSRVYPTELSRFDVDVYNLETGQSFTPNIAEIRVSVNETIGHYADWLGIPSWKIRKTNNLGSRSSIHINQKLIIPIESADALQRFSKVRLEYHMALEEDFYGRYKISDVKSRTIRRGENLWDICNAEGELPLWLFKKYNKHLALDRLMPGTGIWLPVIEEKTEADLAESALEYDGLFPPFYEPIRTGGRPAALVP